MSLNVGDNPVDVQVTAEDGTTIKTYTVTVNRACESTVSIAKSVSPASAVAYHGVVTYMVVLSNTGCLSDTNVLLTDTLPANVTFGQWLEQPAGTVRAGNAITWTGTLTNSTAITFTFTATHTGSYSDVVTNTAHFSGTTQTGRDDAVFTVVRQADLSIAKSGWWDGQAGSPITYTITVRNAGPDEALGATVSDTLPAKVSSPSWECQSGGGASCGADSGAGDIDEDVDLPVGGVVTYTVTGTVTISGTVVNTATVSVPAGVSDPDSDDNQMVHRAEGPYYFPIIYKNYGP